MILPMWVKMSFSEADEALGLTRFEEFDAGFDAAYVHSGDLRIDGDWTGGDLRTAVGVGEYEQLGELVMFVVDGDLTVDGLLDLDEGTLECLGLLVTGTLTAQIIDVDATMLFVFGGADIARLVRFTTTDGTLSIAGRTRCPLVIYDEGDLNVTSAGHILSRRSEGPVAPYEAPSSDSDFDFSGWGWPTVTLTRTEVPAALDASLYDDENWVDAATALEFARSGRPLLRADYPAPS